MLLLAIVTVVFLLAMMVHTALAVFLRERTFWTTAKLISFGLPGLWVFAALASNLFDITAIVASMLAATSFAGAICGYWIKQQI